MACIVKTISEILLDVDTDLLVDFVRCTYDLRVPIKMLPRKEALLQEAVPRIVGSWSWFGSPAAKLMS